MSSPILAVTMKNNPRSIAIQILNRIDREDAFAEPLLDSYLSMNILNNVHDRRLLTQLVYGTLRTRNHLDWFIQHLYKGKSSSMEDGLKNILRTALYQIIFTDRIPSFAAVNEAVKITKKIYPERSGLVNGILRNAIRKMDEIKYPDLKENPPLHISIVHSHPLWMVKRWIKRYGIEETLEFCRSNNNTPPLTLRTNTLKTGRDKILKELLDEGYKAESTKYSHHGIILSNPSMPVREMPQYKKGYIQVQDEASQLISFLVNPGIGEKILDICAGIGVKTSHIAGLMKNTGKIVALDINKNKSETMQKLSDRLGITIIEPQVGDATEDMGKNYHGNFDKVLVDVPCSGIGTLRRNPEIKWRIQENDLKSYPLLQKKILNCSAGYPKRGGMIIYSTCTIEAEENEEVVKDFLANHPDYKRIDPPENISPDLTDKNGFFRTYPHRHGTDGFFGAVLLRR